MKRTGGAIAVAVVLFAAGVAQALDFSADMVTTTRGQRMSSKVFVANDKVRIEAAGAMTITRIDMKVAWLIMPKQGMYMEQPFDPEKVAGTAEKMPGELERVSLGADMVDGKPAMKYRITYTTRDDRATVIQWVDVASDIPIKTEAEDGSWSMEYKNLKVGAQDPSLFEIPAGYQKFTMPDMNEMMSEARKRAGAREQQ